MNSFWLRNRKKEPILKWEDWVRPKEDYHWKVGRSAMELARAWFRKGSLACPVELDSLLRSNARTGAYRLILGEPEFKTPLPERGEGRNHDLWLEATCPSGNMTICIEAKADESFGNLIRDEINKARKHSASTRLPTRAKALLELLFARSCDPAKEPWSNLRYQLITALAGTIIQARHDDSATAVFVVHEFLGKALDPERQRQNDADLKAVLALLYPGCDITNTNKLLGPIPIAGSEKKSCDINLFVGKIQSRLPCDAAEANGHAQDLTNASARISRWQKGQVDPAKEHFELRYGSAEDGELSNWTLVATVGKPNAGVVNVHFLLNPINPSSEATISDVVREVQFYLIEKGEDDPWAYAKYHCGTTANIYSRVHWIYCPPEHQSCE